MTGTVHYVLFMRYLRYRKCWDNVDRSYTHTINIVVHDTQRIYFIFQTPMRYSFKTHGKHPPLKNKNNNNNHRPRNEVGKIQRNEHYCRFGNSSSEESFGIMHQKSTLFDSYLFDNLSLNK